MEEPSTTPTAKIPGSRLIGQMLGGCIVRKLVGRGGMGEVYLAHHRGLNRPVAVKILPENLTAQPEFVQRFLREARSAAQLDHPNIVQVHDVGQRDGLYYIVMQFVDGQSLDDILTRRKKLPVKDAVTVVRKVAQALAAAHAKGIIHRDIKPANIMVTKEGRVKVMDFGLARPVNASLTMTGEVLGTPYFMAPEQAKGEELDGRSDIYSLGATFFYLLTGRNLFDGGTPFTVAMKHVQEDPPDLSAVDPKIPPAVCRIVARMLEKEPAKRPASMDEVVRELESLRLGVTGGDTMGSPAVAETVEMPGVYRRWLALPRWGRLAILIGAVAVVLALGIALGVKGPAAKKERERIVQKERESLAQQALDRADAYARANPLNVAAVETYYKEVGNLFPDTPQAVEAAKRSGTWLKEAEAKAVAALRARGESFLDAVRKGDHAAFAGHVDLAPESEWIARIGMEMFRALGRVGVTMTTGDPVVDLRAGEGRIPLTFTAPNAPPDTRETVWLLKEGTWKVRPDSLKPAESKRPGEASKTGDLRDTRRPHLPGKLRDRIKEGPDPDAPPPEIPPPPK